MIGKIHAIAPAHYDLTTGETRTYIADMVDVFSYYGCTCSSVYTGYFGVPNCPLQQSLDNDMPIYARGERLSDGEGHAWVIDGYRYEQKFNKYYSMTYPYDYVCTVPNYTYKPYFHCNWGWGGLYNGYVLSYFSPDDTLSNRYSVNNKFLLNIHP